MNKIYKILIALVPMIAITIGVISTNNVSAAGAWLGSSPGNNHSAPGGGGGGGAGCNPGDVYCDGVSWIYYEPTQYMKEHPNDVWLVPAGGWTGGGISRECSQNGFWHFGRNAQAKKYDGYGFFHYLNNVKGLDNGSGTKYSTSNGRWGHYGTYSWKWWRDMVTSHRDIPYKIYPGQLDHVIYDQWGNALYKAKATSWADCWSTSPNANYECVWNSFVNAFHIATGDWPGEDAYSGYLNVDNLYAFCAGGSGLTIKYVGEQKACYGRPGQNVDLATQTFSDDDNDGWVSVDTRIPDFESQGWVLDGVDGATLNGNNISVNVQNNSVTVTVRFHKDAICDEECDEWTPKSYSDATIYQGETSVAIGVKNKTLNTGWYHDSHQYTFYRNTDEEKKLNEGVVYAKPDDEITWKYCYYPGVQFAANETVSKETTDPEPPSMNPEKDNLTNDKFSTIYNWKDNSYHVWTDKVKPDEYETTKNIGVANTDVSFGTILENESYFAQPMNQLTPHSQVNTLPLNPGDTLKGNIATAGTSPIRVTRSDGKYHEWNCNRYDCPYCAEFSADGRQCLRYATGNCYSRCSHTFYANTNTMGQKTDIAEVVVPYNFRNKTSATLSPNATYQYSGEPVVFAGETVTVTDPIITIDKRVNEITQGDDHPNGYATQVDDGKARLIGFLSTQSDGNAWALGAVSDNDGMGNYVDTGDTGRIYRGSDVCGAFNTKFNICEMLENADGQLNANSNLEGEDLDLHSREVGAIDTFNNNTHEGIYNVFDEAAGNYFCVAAAVYPFTVTSNTELNRQGDDAWYISQPSCVKIAKRPSFQVWGAGVYSAGQIKTNNVSNKNNLLGNANPVRILQGAVRDGTNYQAWGEKGGTSNYFGSWTELTTTAQKDVVNFASGASLGYTTGGILPTAANPAGIGYPGGSQYSNSPCLRNPLTIANSECNNNGKVGNASADNIRTSINSDKAALAKRLSDIASIEGSTTIDTNAPETIAGDSANPGQTIAKIRDGNFYITGDIIYNGSYTNLNEVPKYIIYARNGGNIYIDCGVHRIDAILIADGEVNTCTENQYGDTLDDENDPSRSNQLIINGAVVTNTIQLNRTFGANTGGNSDVPAELINYDSSIYLWANRVASAGESGQLTESTTRELAPRY